MSPNLAESSLKSQVPALLLRRLFGAGARRDDAAAAKQHQMPMPSPSPPPAGRRRVFVQTESGCVLGMDLDRGDNAHTVKRRLQLALNVPTGGTSLSFGGRVLEGDLSSVRRDSPLLLTRDSIHRSCSTPCLCPVSKDFEQKDSSGLVEILGSSSTSVKRLVDDVATGIRGGLDPVPIDSGLGGSYYFRDLGGDRVAIVKPTDEEPFAPNNPKGFTGRALGQPGLKKSVRVGETGFREVAAYLLDHENFANVPATALVKITHSVFNINRPMNGGGAPAHDHRQHQTTSKIASFQQFIAHDFDASDHGTSSFPVAAVHRIGILDIRIFNTDRHGGNVLVRKLDGGTGRFGCQTELFPIDHGLCLPENLEDPYFEWIHWAQASIPFSEEELEYIRNLDPIRDATMLRRELPMIREACLRVLILCTIFLKEAATFGLCLAEIGEMMTREFRGMEEEPSKLELVCMEARKKVAEWEPFSPDVEQGEDMGFQFSMDALGGYSDVIRSPRFHCSGMKGSSFRNPLTKLVESMNEDNDDDEDRKEFSMHSSHHRIPSAEFNPPSVYRTTSLNGSVHAVNRSADEQLPSSMCFVRLSDMSAEEWHVFVEKFQELLKEALDECKAAGAQRMKQRLGTSCKF